MGKSLLPNVTLIAASAFAASLSGPPAARAADAAIQTVFASYGYAMDRKDVKDDIVKFCDGKSSCSFKVKNETFSTSKGAPDPSPGNDKGLMVKWKCGDAEHKVQFAEGKDASLDCK